MYQAGKPANTEAADRLQLIGIDEAKNKEKALHLVATF